MADYWLCPALEQFRAELNALYPNRDKTSDGWIGDKYHAESDSDHNPLGWREKPKRWAGPVLAFDVDNDLAVGKNAQALADYLASQLGKHPALMSGAYLIYNGRIISTDRLDEGWRHYPGKNPHKGHVHVSVGRSPSAYNSQSPWGLNGGAPAPEKEENDIMLMLAKSPTDGQVWLSDGISRRRIASMDEVKNLRFLHGKGLLNLAAGGDIQTISVDIAILGRPVDDEFASIQQAIKNIAVQTGAVIDYTAIAKAVNDDAARRWKD